MLNSNEFSQTTNKGKISTFNNEPGIVETLEIMKLFSEDKNSQRPKALQELYLKAMHSYMKQKASNMNSLKPFMSQRSSKQQEKSLFHDSKIYKDIANSHIRISQQKMVTNICITKATILL